MRRRDLLVQLAALGVTGPGLARAAFGAETGYALEGVARALPTAEQRAWQDLEFGMFVHFAPNTWQNVESDNLSTPLSEIDPKELNTDQWVETALAMGARYVVFVAKHQGGFCMWQTQTTEYSIRNTPWKGGKGDVLREIEMSCRKRGVPLGVYVCPRDDHFGAGTGGICKTPELQQKYNAMYREQLTEVFTRYGELVEIWFDGSTVTPVADLVRKYQPRAMVFQGPAATIRWVGNEMGFAPYPCWNGIDAAEARTGVATALDGDPNGSVWLPSEADVSIRRPDWFWSTTNAKLVMTLDALTSVYYRSVGRGAQLLLNIPANREGLLPAPDVSRAREFGAELRRRFGKPLAETRGTGAQVTVELARPARVDTVILQEDTTLGERVRGYRLEGRVAGAWAPLGEGSAIGHKRIQPVQAQTVSAVRLTVTRAAAEPAIRRLAVFDTGVAPPQDWDAASELWAPNLAGTWTGGQFAVDLTKGISVAGQYVLRFVPEQGKVTALRDVKLELGGVAALALVRTRGDEVLLDITGLDKSVRVSGTVVGADRGEILMERR